MNSKTDPHQVVNHALQQLDVSLAHTPTSMDETAYWLRHDGLDDPELADLTDLPFVTIDNEDSRDLDQAMHIEGDHLSGYRVRYALADASYYIRPGSALFDEALQRGTTYYTPLLAAAMLPTDLSEGLISLNPNVTRRSLVFDMALNEDATVTNCTIVRARIRSQAKLSYAGVQQWLDSSAADTQAYHHSMRLLKEVGIKLIAASESRGVIKFDRQETQISVDGKPPRFLATVRERYDTERYNEQISLLCNMQGAELLLGLSGVTDVVQSVFRVHEAPLRKSLTQLKETLNTLADTLNEPQRWRWQEGQSLATYVEELPEDEHHERTVRAIQRQIMQAQRGSTFTPEPGEHHALKACSYARFSSPMREIVGIFTHKELLEALSGGLFDNDADHDLRERVIDAANSARQRQRQLDKQMEFAALLSVFGKELELDTPNWHTGTIMGMRSDKLYINFDDMALDVKVYRNDLNTTFKTQYAIDAITAKPADSRAPTWHLGQGVRLKITAFEKQRQRFVFSVQSIETHHSV